LVTVWPLTAYLLSACCCFGCSAYYHLTFCKNEQTARATAKLDYIGVATLFLGSAYPLISYKFACGEYFVFWRHFFIVVLMISTLICMIVLMFPQFGNNSLRAGVFVLFACAVLIPVIFLCKHYDPVYSLAPNLGLYSLGLLSYTLALVIYLGRIPERFAPGKFDYLGSSH